MKFKFNLENITVGELKIGTVLIESEVSTSELVSIRTETEHILGSLPKYINQLASGYKEANRRAITKEHAIKMSETIFGDLFSKLKENEAEIKNNKGQGE